MFLMQFPRRCNHDLYPRRENCAGTTDQRFVTSCPCRIETPKGPGRTWSKEEALAILEKSDGKRNFNEGRNLYHATLCSKCHRLGGEGVRSAQTYPPLQEIFRVGTCWMRLSSQSKAISDQYGSHQVLTTDGNCSGWTRGRDCRTRSTFTKRTLMQSQLS